jgi:hypothetical protein
VAFDLSTAQPVQNPPAPGGGGGFDLSTAMPDGVDPMAVHLQRLAQLPKFESPLAWDSDGVAREWPNDPWLAPRPKVVTPSQQTAIENAEALGMRTHARTGDGQQSVCSSVEAQTGINPWTRVRSTKSRPKTSRHSIATGRARIGEESEHVDSTTLANAAERLGNEFETAAQPEVHRHGGPKEERRRCLMTSMHRTKA